MLGTLGVGLPGRHAGRGRMAIRGTDPLLPAVETRSGRRRERGLCRRSDGSGGDPEASRRTVTGASYGGPEIAGVHSRSTGIQRKVRSEGRESGQGVTSEGAGSSVP